MMPDSERDAEIDRLEALVDGSLPWEQWPADPLARLEEVKKRNALLDGAIAALSDLTAIVRTQAAELAKVRQERDAAVAVLREIEAGPILVFESSNIQFRKESEIQLARTFLATLNTEADDAAV